MNINTGFLKNPLVWIAALGGVAVLIWVFFKQLRETFSSGVSDAASAPGDLIKKTLAGTAEGIKSAGSTLVVNPVKSAWNYLFGNDSGSQAAATSANTSQDSYYDSDEDYDPNRYVF